MLGHEDGRSVGAPDKDVDQAREAAGSSDDGGASDYCRLQQPPSGAGAGDLHNHGAACHTATPSFVHACNGDLTLLCGPLVRQHTGHTPIKGLRKW